jgi:hypothetical protein
MTPSLSASSRVLDMDAPGECSRMRPRRHPPFGWSFSIAILIALAGALLLIIQWMWGRMLWVDEEMIAINLRDRSLRDLAGALSLGQAAPYGWLVLERAMLLLFGTGERALRCIPMLFGIATLATTVWIGRRWMTASGAASLAFLCAMGQWIPFHALELKHYSADICFGLFLPALAAWAVETGGARRILVWWMAAAAAQWMSNGALFVAPACAIVIVLTVARRFGWREAVVAAAPGSIWLASFALNYRVTLAPAMSSTFLQGYWTPAFPPAGAGFGQTLQWLANQLTPLSIKPGGSGFPVAFWGAFVAGLLAARVEPPVFRLLYASVPCSAFVWTAVRLVPMSERLGLWFVPALYVGIAMAAEAAVAILAAARARRSWIRGTVGVAALALLVAVGADIYARGTIYVALRPYASNHDLDDRGAIGWLARQRRPGDVWLAPYLSLPAIWWYAGPGASSPAVEASLEFGSPSCGGREVGAWVAKDSARRVLVYLGFGHDTPKEFDETLVGRLSSLGAVTAYRAFHSGHALVIDLSEPSTGSVTLASLGARSPAARRSADSSGCITIAPARPW